MPAEVCGLRPGAKVLEIGPGTGQATGELPARGAEVLAVEMGPALPPGYASASAARASS